MRKKWRNRVVEEGKKYFDYYNVFTYKELQEIAPVETKGLELCHSSAQTEAWKIKEKATLFSEKKYFKKARKAHTIAENVLKAFFQIFLANKVWFGLVKSSVAYAFGIQIYILIKVCL